MMAMLLLIVGSSGATCLPKRPLSELQPRVVFQSTPDVMQIAEVLNRTRRIQQLQNRTVSIRAEGVTLQSNLVWERAKHFRMIGKFSAFTGVDFDLGSNEEVFWMSSKRTQPPTLFFARHDQFESQLNRQILPVSPLWLIEAIGIVELDPSTVTRSPYTTPDGMLVIDNVVPSPAGNYERTLIFDPKPARIRQVILKDPSGRRLATAWQDQHQRYPEIDCELPSKIKIQLLPINGAPMDLQLDVGRYSINATEGNDPNRFVIPNERDFQKVNLVEFNQNSISAIVPPAYERQLPAQPRTSYRGLESQTLRR